MKEQIIYEFRDGLSMLELGKKYKLPTLTIEEIIRNEMITSEFIFEPLELEGLDIDEVDLNPSRPF